MEHSQGLFKSRIFRYTAISLLFKVLMTLSVKAAPPYAFTVGEKASKGKQSFRNELKFPTTDNLRIDAPAERRILNDSLLSNPATPGIFPSFFMSGFESSSFLWKDKKRRNLIKETEHDKYVFEDYKMLHDLGIRVSREGILWPMVDVRGAYDFSSLDPMIAAANKNQVSVIWEMCHYGYPDDLDPFSDEFVARFAAYSKAAAQYIIARTKPPYFFSPINEITFLSFMGAEWGWVAPYTKTKEDRFKLRINLCKAAIAAVKAIRTVEPFARMIHFDPLVNVVAPRDRPDQQHAAWNETFADTFVAWDILYGRLHPELGGSPEILDIVGPNCYWFGQMEYRTSGPHQPLEENDDRVVPAADLIQLVWSKYGRPMIIAETGTFAEKRPLWLKDIVEESLAAINKGVDLQGICLFPAVDMPDWHTPKWLRNGFADIIPKGDDLTRKIYKPYVSQLIKWQRKLNKVHFKSRNVAEDPANLADVIEAAKNSKKLPDKDWH